MNRSGLIRTALIVPGLTATAIGAAILAAPRAFYSSYGIGLGANASLLSEMRAPGGGLVGAGLVMLLSLVAPGFALSSLLVAAATFLGYGAARLVSLAVDGAPGSGILTAIGIELAIGLICAVALLQVRRTA